MSKSYFIVAEIHLKQVDLCFTLETQQGQGISTSFLETREGGLVYLF